MEKLGGPSLWGERLGPGDTRLGESVSRVDHKDQLLKHKTNMSKSIPSMAKIADKIWQYYEWLEKLGGQ